MWMPCRGGHAQWLAASTVPSRKPRPSWPRRWPLIHVQSWLAAGKRPEWADVAAMDTETIAYHSQWASLKAAAEVAGESPRPLPPRDSRLEETGGKHRGSDERPHI
ncbi:hypothetical protein AAFF_G00348040 [Aldrovandia affinis]|uniref:Uncharacterized protein n=1 Tax=Aldrovandia affinis TaxID=143900 RepID=A0AAD7R5M9_9TELE|nr:hypothetical protein AAFF_G00348040 [Aldrovandia affinis]